MSNLYLNNSGSIWRKWDLHVHTPFSHTSTYSGKDDEEKWDEFFKSLENLPKDIEVLGINDYLFLDGYKKVLAHKEKGNLQNIKLLLPVIEFRLKEFVGHTSLKRINYHIVFADETMVTHQQIESQFLSKLSGSCNLDCENPDTISWAGVVTPKSLLDLGKEIYKKTPKNKRTNNHFFKIGFDNINYSLETIINALGEGSAKNTYLKNNYYKVIGKSEWESFRWTGSASEKKTLINSSHFVFSSSPTTKDATNGKKNLIEQGVNSRLLHCSDAHKAANDPNSTKPKELGHCFTWIKSDPTFEGLRQIIHEPKERICIQEENPEESKKHWKIKSLEINNSNVKLLPNQKIKFNSYLTSIIGGRATGKSALIKFISVFNGERDPYIEKLLDNEDYLNLKLTLNNSDNEEECFEVHNLNNENYGLPIYYLSQEDIEKFSDENRKEVHRKEFLKTIGIDNTEYYYHEEKQSIDAALEKLKEIDSNEEEFKTFIEELSFKRKLIFIKSKNYIDRSAELIKNLNKEKNKYSTKKTKDAVEEISKLLKKANKIKKIQQSSILEQITTKTSDLNELIKEYNSIITDSEFDLKTYQDQIKALKQYNLENLKKDLRKNNETFDLYIKNLRVECAPQIEILKNEGIDFKTIQQSVENLDKQILQIEGQLESFNKNQENKEKLISTLISAFDLYENSIEESENEIKEKYENFIKDRSKLFERIFQGVKVEPKKYLNKRKLKKDFKDLCYSERKNEFNDYFNDLTVDNYFETFNKNFLLKVLESKSNFKKDAGGYYSAIKLIYSDFIDDYFQVHPRIVFEEKELGDMSGGQQATLMLKLKLASEGIKKDIIILDQPENHLDNKFINNHLIDLFKLIKKHKQLIVVSHSANIVVGSDSEEIIIANMDNEKDLKYKSGAIENPEIKNQIIDILEGGKTAFDLRRKKLF